MAGVALGSQRHRIAVAVVAYSHAEANLTTIRMVEEYLDEHSLPLFDEDDLLSAAAHPDGEAQTRLGPPRTQGTQPVGAAGGRDEPPRPC